MEETGIPGRHIPECLGTGVAQNEAELQLALQTELANCSSFWQTPEPGKQRSNSSEWHSNVISRDSTELQQLKRDRPEHPNSVLRTQDASPNLTESKPSRLSQLHSGFSSCSKPQPRQKSPQPSTLEIVNLPKTCPNSTSKPRTEQSPKTSGKPSKPEKQSTPTRPSTSTKKSPTLHKQPTTRGPSTHQKRTTAHPKGATPTKKSATPQKLSAALQRQPMSPAPKKAARNLHKQETPATDSVAQLFCELCNRTLDLAAADVAYLECAQHCFHDACLAAWLQNHSKCPTCREPTQARR